MVSVSERARVAAPRLGPGDVVDRFHALELERRRREVELALAVGEIDEQGLFEADGMRTARSWCRGVGRWTNAEAGHGLRIAKLLRTHAESLPVEVAMTLPVGHLRELARVAANPRCGDQVDEVMPTLLFWAESLDHDAFTTITRRWESLADADGAHDDHEESHLRRRVTLSPDSSGGSLHGHLDGMQFAIVSEIFDRFCDAELMGDWEEAKQVWGDQATPDRMKRTAAQRRADAFVAMVLQAASAPPGSKTPRPFVNIVVDYDTFVAAAQRATGTTPTATADPTGGDTEGIGADETDEAEDESGDEAEPRTADESGNGVPRSLRRAATDPARRRCETTSGLRLHPDDVFAAAVHGAVRRIVTDPAGVIVDAGRRTRLFTGALRDVVMALDARCPCPGCTIRRRREADHLLAWNHHGETAAVNAGPLCRWHNNVKNRGFTVHRDARGAWHYHRPDGTEVTPA